MATADELRAELRVECRASGLRADRTPTRSDVRRRRRQIAATVGVVAVGLVWLSIARRSGAPLLGHTAVAWTSVLLAGGFATYAAGQERHLRRVERITAELVELDARVAQEVIDHVALSDLDGSLRRSLLLDDTLGGLLDGAMTLTKAHAGTLYLLRDDLSPSVWTRRGAGASPDTRPGSVAARVAGGADPVLVDAAGRDVARAGSRMAAPIDVNGIRVAVVEVADAGEGVYDHVDLELLARFCTSAAHALDGSVLYRDALERSQRSAGLSLDDDYY